MKNNLSRVSVYLMLAMLFLGAVFVASPAKAAPAATTVEVVNAVDGTNNLHFTTAEKAVNDNIVINITVKDVTGLFAWQFRLQWDLTLLEYVSAVLPTDHVFAGRNIFEVGPVTNPGEVVYGAVLANLAQTTFTGTGTMAQVTLKIIAGVSQGGPVMVQCNLPLINPPPASPADTFLQDNTGADIPFTAVNGHYRYEWVAPSTKPSFWLKPAEYKATALHETVALDVMVEDVDAGWEIIAFQFSLTWNVTILAPKAVGVGPYYDAGTFMEAFQYAPGGVWYAADINTHYRPFPLHELPLDYNYSTFGIILMPDPNQNFTYHAPFPNGGGKLMTVYFDAIVETISPVELWTYIEFIGEDILCMNKYGVDVDYARTAPCHYRAPMKILGLGIDVYTQYPFPYGGQGGNQTSDSFGPQDLVCLTAYVTYNEYPVQQKLVGFEIFHQGSVPGSIYDIWREGTTDADGKTTVCFRLPWPCDDPVHKIFGWWYVNATVEVAGQVVVDNLKFWVWWPVEVVSIEPKQTEVIQTKQGCTLDFIMVYRRYDAIEIPVVLTATIYDELGFFIGSAYLSTTVSNDPVAYDVDGNPIPHDYTWEFTISIPSNAVVGKGIAFGNAFNTTPWNGGTPYCPEVTNTIDFYISKP